jgi:hypothetical protein
VVVGVGSGVAVVAGLVSVAAAACTVCGAAGAVAVAVCVVDELACLMPEPNSLPVCPLSGGAPRAVASGSAYSFATGLEGSTCTGEPPDASAEDGSASAQTVQTDVSNGRARTRWRIAGLW